MSPLQQEQPDVPLNRPRMCLNMYTAAMMIMIPTIYVAGVMLIAFFPYWALRFLHNARI